MSSKLQIGETATYAVGHIALSYLTGKASAKPLNVKVNIPLVLTFSILPDIDLLIPMLQHGGPTHSIVLYIIMAFPAILLWKKQTIPYLAALASHPLLGDYLTRPTIAAGVQLFFPVTTNWYSAGSVAAIPMYIYSEIVLFSAFLILMWTTRDIRTLFKPHPSNMLFVVPFLTALLPVFLQFPIRVPGLLIIPHFVLVVFLAFPIVIDIKHFMSQH